MIGYQPEVILAGRKINDNMGQFVARKALEELQKIGIKPAEARVNVLGVTFKENSADIRNSQVFAMIRQLERDGFTVKVADPIADQEEVLRLEDLILTPLEDLAPAPVLILAVSHESYLVQGQELINNLTASPGILIDVKAALRSCDLAPGVRYWSL